MTDTPRIRAAPRSTGAPWFAPLAICALLSAPATSPLLGQAGGWPTLADAGVEYISSSGAVQVSLSGQIDLELMHLSDSWVGLASRSAGEPPLAETRVRCSRCHVDMGFAADGGLLPSYRLRVFTDVFLGDHVYGLIEVRSDRGHAPTDSDPQIRIEQAYARIASESGALGFQAGRFATPVGSYPGRHLTIVDPFIRPPLAYDYRTLMSRTLIPRDAGLLVGWRDGIEFLRKPGTPPIWDVPYLWGAMAFGGVGPLSLRVAATAGSPSSPPEDWTLEWDRFKTPTWTVGARLNLGPALQVGTSWSEGPWLGEIVDGTVRLDPMAPPDTEPPPLEDFEQRVFTIDAAYARGPTMIRGEVMLDRWEVPNVEDAPREVIYSVEVQRDVVAGIWIAGRVGKIDFRPLSDGRGDASPLPDGAIDWDLDVMRFEASFGYRITRNAGVVVSGLEQRRERVPRSIKEKGSEVDEGARLFGVKLWWAF